MSKLRKWLLGAEVMEHLDISRLDLFELVKNGRLQAHDPDTGARLEIGNRSLPLIPSNDFMGPLIELTKNRIKFLGTPLREASAEELGKLCFLVSEVEAIEKDRQKTKTQNKKKKVMVIRNDTPLPTISDALPEIDEAYNVVKQDGGGWSDRPGGDIQRQTAVLAWFDENKARLTCLKKSYLKDLALYNFGSGQEKRNFYTRLIGKIVEETAHQKITSQEIIDCLRRLKKSKENGELLLRGIHTIANS
jgi:hypothetical protein